MENATPTLLEDSFELELEKQVKFAWEEGILGGGKSLWEDRHEKAGNVLEARSNYRK